MMPGGFRIQSVAIEGFKGFTTRQVIDLDGCHAFLLGQNGSGKSSIIEAIRWGLFGSTGRPNEVVANRGYPERCRVEITLLREGTRWNLRRTLRRGASGGSEAILTDTNGQDRSMREIMPQLDSAEAGEGMHIIFSPQATPLRRQPEDLSPFERTVFRHLGLTNPRALLSQTEAFVFQQEIVENSLGEQLTSVRASIDKQISDWKHQRGVILGTPPWGNEPLPTVAESENKVRNLITEITGKPPDASLSGVSLDALIESAENSLKSRRTQNRSVLEKEGSDLQERLDCIEVFRFTQERIEKKHSELLSVQSRLQDSLSDVSFEDLQDAVAQKRAEVDIVDLTRRVVENAVSLVSRVQDAAVVCPVCKTSHLRHDLEESLQQSETQLSGDSSSELTQLQNRLDAAEELTKESQVILDDLAVLTINLNEARSNIAPEDSEQFPDPVGIAQIDAVVAPLLDRLDSIQAQIDDQDSWFNSTNARLSSLKTEERFQQIQKRLQSLDQSKNRFGEVENAFQDLVSFGGSVQSIQKAVETRLRERLDEDIPGVSESLSRAFAALTRHSWYDRLVIAKDMLPKLQLRVASSQDPFEIEDPTDVLNGQSESAVELAPYFAFSQAEETPTEVYLVMLDDPTRAFDEEHTGILIERLAELGSNVQLIVASQETARFRDMLPKNFDRSDYVIVEPTSWSRQTGPVLVVERE